MLPVAIVFLRSPGSLKRNQVLNATGRSKSLNASDFDGHTQLRTHVLH